jgi:Protein of unknown function (DUF2924)
MAGGSSRTQPAPAPAAALEVELARLGAMTVDQLRATWWNVFASNAPPAFTKDLLARAIAFHAQEKALGGLTGQTVRLLRSLIKPGVDPPRQVKVGSVIVREHKGVVHDVLVVPGGFCWQGKTYDSLSTIAKSITGTSWNGPRFFGLREKRKNTDNLQSHATTSRQGDKEPIEESRTSGKRSGRRSSLRAASASERTP